MLDGDEELEVIIIDMRGYANTVKYCKRCGIELNRDNSYTTSFKRGNTKRLYYVTNCKKCTRDIRIENPPKSRGTEYNRIQYLRAISKPGGMERKVKYQTDLRNKYRNTILDTYGPICSCCGESNRKFLTIDHVNNDGYLERKKHSGLSLYPRIIREGFPDTIRILCWNCNTGRYHNGGICPHKEIS